MTRFKRLIFIFLTGLLLYAGTPAKAHPSDMYFQTIRAEISSQNIFIEWTIKPGPLLANWMWSGVDQNQNDQIEPDELNTWGQEYAGMLGATLNGMPLDLRLEDIYFPSARTDLQSGDDPIRISLNADWSQPLDERGELVIFNRFEEQNSINWFYVTALDGIGFEKPVQSGGKLGVIFHKDGGTQQDLLTSWDSGKPSLPPGQSKDPVSQSAEQVIPELQKETPQEILTRLVKVKELSAQFYLLALIISGALGALHALTPGHGKTVVAAYLVGSRGTTKHAIALGSIVTLTHTGSVFLLGVVTLVASKYFLPSNLIPLLEILSGVLIVGLGISLLIGRWRDLRKNAAEQDHHHHDHNHAHDHEHDHHHDHEHEHSHSREIPDQITWRSLITLGVSGGLVPCPDAVAILLVAVAIHRIALGLALILAFSFGLALVLILIGLVMVNSRRLFDRMDAFSRFAPAMPIVSAAAVIILGMALTYGAATKVQGTNLLSITEAVSGSVSEAGAGFEIADSRVLFLGLDENGKKQVLLKNMSDDEVRILTHEANDVTGFELSPDGTRFTYLSNRTLQDSDIWLYNLTTNESRKLVDCTGYLCWQASWSPNGEQVIFEKVNMRAAEGKLNLPTLEWVNVETGEGTSVFQDDTLPGYYPAWSPNGEWLSYRAPGGNIRMQNLSAGEEFMVTSAVSGPVYWSPDSSGFLFANGTVVQDKFITRLFFYDLEKREFHQVNGEGNFEDSIAAWSPDGTKIAFIRRDLTASYGEQIWMMDADGSNAIQLTQSPASIHDGLNWSPNGQFLLAHEYLLDKPLSEPRIILIDVESAEVKVLTEGSNAVWLP